jgi:hypothetical protein
MIDFAKLTNPEIQDLQLIISKNVEKSELERHYLYTNDIEEKSVIYIWCYRFLYSVCNLTKESGLKQELKKELDSNRDIYYQMNEYMFKIKVQNFNRFRILKKMKILHSNNPCIDDLIDSFAILLEKTNVLSMARLKGIILEGNSEKEFKKIFDVDVNKLKESTDFMDGLEPESEEFAEKPELDDFSSEAEKEEQIEEKSEEKPIKRKLEFREPVF